MHLFNICLCLNLHICHCLQLSNLDFFNALICYINVDHLTSDCKSLIHLHPDTFVLLWCPWFQGTGDATPSSCCDLIHDSRVRVMPLHPHAVILSMISGYGWRYSILMLWLCPWFQGTGDATPSSCCDFIHDFRVRVTPQTPRTSQTTTRTNCDGSWKRSRDRRNSSRSSWNRKTRI